MLLIVLSAFVTAINDLEYSTVGYVWAALNVLANVAYLASLRIFLSDTQLSPLDKTFHSNLLSIIPILPISLLFGEVPNVVTALRQRSPAFQLAYIGSGFLTTGVCASAFWTISLTNGSTLSFIGGFNKVPIILLSLFLFDMRISIAGWIGVTLGVVAGIVFMKAKSFSKSVILEKDAKQYVDRHLMFEVADHNKLQSSSFSSEPSPRWVSSEVHRNQKDRSTADLIPKSKSDALPRLPAHR